MKEVQLDLESMPAQNITKAETCEIDIEFAKSPLSGKFIKIIFIIFTGLVGAIITVGYLRTRNEEAKKKKSVLSVGERRITGGLYFIRFLW